MWPVNARKRDEAAEKTMMMVVMVMKKTMMMVVVMMKKTMMMVVMLGKLHLSRLLPRASGIIGLHQSESI